jgi:hypothetical protein
VADWLHALGTSIAANASAPPPLATDPPLATLERIAGDESERPETRAHVRQQREWLELIYAQCVQLSAMEPT